MKLLISMAALLALAGCASFSDDARFSPVEQAVKERTGAQTKWARNEDEANTVRARVKARTGITLEWEIIRLGEPLPGHEAGEALAEAAVS